MEVFGKSRSGEIVFLRHMVASIMEAVVVEMVLASHNTLYYLMDSLVGGTSLLEHAAENSQSNGDSILTGMKDVALIGLRYRLNSDELSPESKDGGESDDDDDDDDDDEDAEEQDEDGEGDGEDDASGDEDNNADENAGDSIEANGQGGSDEEEDDEDDDDDDDDDDNDDDDDEDEEEEEEDIRQPPTKKRK